MKNIREKAIEIYPALEGDVSGTSKNLVRRNGFQAGANYVLDAIQSCIDRHEDGCLALEAIILTIDELKNK